MATCALYGARRRLHQCDILKMLPPAVKTFSCKNMKEKDSNFQRQTELLHNLHAYISLPQLSKLRLQVGVCFLYQGEKKKLKCEADVSNFCLVVPFTKYNVIARHHEPSVETHVCTTYTMYHH